MESLEKNKPKSGGEQKVEEYVNRIKGGESKDIIFQGLPESFKASIEHKLNEKDSKEINKTKEEKYQVDQQKIKELREQLGIIESDKNTELQKKIEQLVDNRINIKFDTKTWNEQTKSVEKLSGFSDIIDFAGRKIVVMDVNGRNMPFYLSTGHGGKIDVTSGKWYPIFGIDPNEGWLNKLSGKEINNYYGSDILKKISETLDQKIGDIRDKDDIPKVGSVGAHMDIINKDFVPVENGREDTRQKLEKNIEDVINYLKIQY